MVGSPDGIVGTERGERRRAGARGTRADGERGVLFGMLGAGCGNPLYVRELLAAARNERLSGADDKITALRAVASSAVGASVSAGSHG